MKPIANLSKFKIGENGHAHFNRKPAIFPQIKISNFSYPPGGLDTPEFDILPEFDETAYPAILMTHWTRADVFFKHLDNSKAILVTMEDEISKDIRAHNVFFKKILALSGKLHGDDMFNLLIKRAIGHSPKLFQDHPEEPHQLSRDQYRLVIKILRHGTPEFGKDYMIEINKECLDNILFVELRDIYSDPTGTLDSIANFLDMEVNEEIQELYYQYIAAHANPEEFISTLKG